MLNQSPTQPRLLSAAGQVAEIAGKHAADAEANRRLHPDVVQTVLEAGFARHFVPARWGGNAATFAEVTLAVAAIGECCASTAWYASLTASLGRMAAYLPLEGQREIWQEGPDPLIVGGLMPLGRAEPVDGGWRVSGEWPFVSAIEFSSWALVCGMTVTTERPEARFFAVPRNCYGIVDTWFNVGMRATGSNTLVMDDVFVPAARSFARDEVAEGRAVDPTALCHRVPLKAANGLAFATPVLGAASGALQLWTAWIAEKMRTGPNPGMSGGGSRAYDVILARSAGEIDAARLLLERAARLADEGAVPPLQAAQNSRDCALAVDLLVTAVDRLFRSAGTRAQADGNALQRSWRDVHAAASHVVLQFEPAASAYSNQVLKQN